MPFPTGPQGVLMDVMAKMSPSDEFIYAHLVRTGALVGISILLWILAAIYLLKVVLPLFWKSSSPTPVNLLYFQPAANMLRVCASAPLVPKMSLFDVGLLGQLSSEFEQLLDGSVTSIFLIVKLLKLVPLVPMTPVAFIDTSPHALAGFKAGQ